MIAKLDLPGFAAGPEGAEGLARMAATAGLVITAVGVAAVLWIMISSKRDRAITVTMQVLAIVGVAGGITLLSLGLGHEGKPTYEWQQAEQAAVRGSVISAVEGAWAIEIPESEHGKIFDTTDEAEVVFIAVPTGSNSQVQCKLTNFLSSDKKSQRVVAQDKSGRMQLGITCDGVGEPAKRK